MASITLSNEVLNLHLREPFRISRGVQTIARPVLAHVSYGDVAGVGEAAPSTYYGETGETVRTCLRLFAEELGDDPFNLQSICERLDARIQRNAAAKAAVECALHDLVGKLLGVPVYRLLGLDCTRTPRTSFTIGIAEPAEMARKAGAATAFPILKVKVGTDDDLTRLHAIRDVRPDATIRVDANAAWTPRQAVERIMALAPLDLEFVEQPIPVGDPEALRWVRDRSPLRIFADESCVTAAHVHALAGAVDGIVVKLAKCGGLRAAQRQIEAAHLHGMEVMLGCMVESAVGITAAAHLTPLVEYADLDGNLLVTDDPFRGVRVEDGRLVLPGKPGLGVQRMSTGTAAAADEDSVGATP